MSNLSHKDIRKIFKNIQDKYKSSGYDLSDVKLKISKYPVYNNGRRSNLDPKLSGGSWTAKKEIVINPHYSDVISHYQYSGSDQSFINQIIAHELGHEIDHNHLSDQQRQELLSKIKKENFNTEYLKTVSKEKWHKEAIPEYLATKLNKTCYRVTYNDVGIYEALYQELLKSPNGNKIWHQLLSSGVFSWLPKPKVKKYSSKLNSYFTELGLREFKKWCLPIFEKYLNPHNIKVTEYDVIGKIVYLDKYQIVAEVE